VSNDYYAVLGVDPGASADDIKRAFRALAREHHPDATGGDDARYKEISEAYAVLSDPAKRRQYDAARAGIGTWSSPWGSPFASTIEDIFDTFFGGAGRTYREQTRTRHGESVEVAVEVTLEEVVRGGTRPLRFERYEPCERCGGEGTEPGTYAERCEHCQGTGQMSQARRTVIGNIMTSYPCRDCGGTGWVVPNPCRDCRGAGRVARDVEVPLEIPPGIAEGDRMRLSGEGEAGAAGGGRGDLYVRFVVVPDERFERVGDDLVAWAEIPMTTAALGGEVTIETIDGSEQLSVPAGTQSGATFRFRAAGAPRRNGRGRGDLIARAHVVTPTKLDGEQEELLRKLAAARGEDTAEGSGFRSAVRRVLGRDR
jgi:molecular chaperone DnaJ